MLRRNGISEQAVVAKNQRLYCAIPPHEASVPKDLKLCLETSNPFPTNGRRADGKPDAKRAKSCFEQHPGELVHVSAIQNA